MMVKETSLKVDIGVMKNEIQNIKDTAIETKLQNTAEHLDIKATLKDIDSKLESAFTKKADKEDLKDLRDKGWGLVVAVVVAFLGLIATSLKAFLGQ
jgi:hypothetical protein